VIVSFDLLVFLAWLFLSTFIPGAILSFSILRKDGQFSVIEKLFIGFALGFVLLPLIPFLLYLIAGVEYSYSIGLLSIAALYAIALAFFVKNKAYEGLMPEGGLKLVPKDAIIPLALLLVLVVSYLIRIGSYSPIYQELDPYFYTYVTQQVLTLGANPFNDQTAWYPEVSVSHRLVPMLSYLEAVWYSLYTGGGPYDNLTLALIASMYPPLAAVLSVFFIYLLVSTATGKREWGIISGALASFVPVFIYKLAAGEQEVQPYAFFALAFFYAMYAISMKRKDIRLPGKELSFGKDAVFPLLAGLAFAALALGSNSQILAVASIIIFLGVQSILYFLRDTDAGELRHLLIFNAIVFVVGPLLGSSILKPLFEEGGLSATMAVAFAAPLALCAALYAIKLKVPDKNTGTLVLGAILLLGLIMYAATPVGDYIKGIGQSGFGIAQFNRPLDRTIAEQGTAATSFGGQLGFIAASYSLPAALDSLGKLVDSLLFIVLVPFSIIANIVLGLFVGMVNLFLGTTVEYTTKDVSFLLFWISLFWVAAGIAFWKFAKKEGDAVFMLLLAMIMPPFVVGIVKAKYTIYAGVLLAVAIGFVLSAAASAIGSLFGGKDKDKMIYAAPLLIGVALVLLQFSFQGFAPSLLWGSFQTLYQNNPDALAAKFHDFCTASNDPDVCAAAADPTGYASYGIEYQYNNKLCMLSVFSNYSSFAYMFDSDPSNDYLVPSLEASAASFRCQRLTDYWVDSMEWIRNSTEADARITSWWDYGHWINFFGQRDTVLRNEHASTEMIGAVAHGYIDASPDELKSWMEAHGSQYALFDVELVLGGGSLGGKYGALNYLSCAWDNQTTVAQAPTQSQCEADHLWETIYVTSNPCTISSLTGQTGYTAYEIYEGGRYTPDYPSYCVQPTDPNVVAYCQNAVSAVPAYCVGNVTLANGQSVYGTYYLNETNPNGDLKINKAIMQLPYQLPSTYHLGPVTAFTLFYTEDAVWLDNGVVTSGYADRKGKFYDSNIYRAIFLRELPGFTLVYDSPTGAVKIYKISGS
jgi:asparagine N-glycosylation enzyme membrane subunit Stt3